MVRRIILAVAIAAGAIACTACTEKASTSASQCEKLWSANSGTANPFPDDPAATRQYHDRYVKNCETTNGQLN